MKKHASKLPIQAMIASVISSATEKLAEDEAARGKKVRNLLAYEKKEHGHVPTPHEEEQEHEKTASANLQDDYIMKLATAVEYIAGNLNTIEFPRQGVIQKVAEEMGHSPQGAGKGPGSLEVSEAIGGQQNYNLGKSKTHNAAASQAGAALSGSHPADGKTQLENDMHHAPGGGNIAPTAKYPEKGPLVSGPSASGHHKEAASIQELYQQSIKSVPNQEKTAAVNKLRQAVLSKLAGEDVMKANISAERTANPLAGMGQLESFDADKPAPHQAGDHTGGFGNQARRLIASNEAAIHATKGDAKGPVKTQLSEVLEEPALSSSSDPVLEENLRNTGKAGVKIAAARTLLEKVAQQGCTCETIDGECAFCSLKQKVAAAAQSKRGSTKIAGVPDAMGGGGMPPSPTMSGGGAGMTPMADAGAGTDGCICGGTGECRVCKLKAALAAAKAQAQGGAADMMPGGMPGGMSQGDPTGAAPAGGSY